MTQAKAIDDGRDEVPIPALEKRLPSLGPFTLIALDLDGTLLRPDKGLSQRCAQAVKQAESRGARVVLAAANAPAGMIRVFQFLNLKAPQICFNGAVVYDPVAKNVLFHDPISPEVAQRIVRIARSTDNKVTIKIEVIDQRYVDDIGTNPGLTSVSAEHYHSGDLGALGKAIAEPVTKITLTSSPSDIDRIKRKINQMLPGKISVLASDSHIMQMVNCGVNKGTALMQIADYLRVDPENVLAMGDGVNDIEMIRWAGLGVAMGNAFNSVKQVAHMVGPSNAEDGVAVVLAKYVLR
jgi:Cof subfamily protein (haloacid dehalogenase superfamily)